MHPAKAVGLAVLAVAVLIAGAAFLFAPPEGRVSSLASAAVVAGAGLVLLSRGFQNSGS